ncbi:hypothetical protein GCM10017687_36710 [Streptomyces echinatus]
MIPLSHAQQRLWFLNRLEGPNATYTSAGLLRLTGELDRTRATSRVCRTSSTGHEPFAHGLRQHDDVPGQRILAPGEPRLEAAVTEVGPQELDGELAELACRAFDWRRRYPSGHAVALSEREHVLAW